MTNRTAIFLTLSYLLFLGACSSDSNFPDATGKGTIRAINMIETSPDLQFLIEERLISSVPYKGASSFREFDDLNYNFNVETFFAGADVNTRILRRNLDVVADRDYTFLIGGTVASPSLTLWETSKAEFADNSTLMRTRFAHTASTLVAVDYYFAADGVLPVMGEQVATLSFGGISEPIEFETGAYAITVTTAGDPTNILYTSSAFNFAAQSDFIITPFDGDADDNAPFIVRAFGSLGSEISMLDSSFPATAEFLHGSLDLGVSDIYDDEMLMSQLVAGHAFQDLSAEIPIAAGDTTFRYTPTGSTGSVTFEGTTTLNAGLRYRIAAQGIAGSFITTSHLPNRRPIETAARLLFFQTSTNFDFLSFYVVDRGETIDGQVPFRSGVASGVGSGSSGIAPGSYDVYVTEIGETVILDGPVPIDVGLSDVVDFVVFDTVDPAVLDLQIISGP